MHHFFAPEGSLEGPLVRLAGDEGHHAVRVLRVAPGETISVADGTGGVVEAVVRQAGPDVVQAEVVRSLDRPRPRPEVTLYQAVLRREKMEACVQKAVEVGAGRIVPVLCERSVVRWDDAKRERHRGRWTEIARAAAKQCRSPWLTPVDLFRRPDEVGGEEVLLALEAGAAGVLRDALPASPPATVGVVVGPEGGLTPDEIAVLEGGGGHAVTLGERILRSETAGPVVVALVGHAYGHLG